MTSKTLTQQIYQELRNIQEGQVISYSELARRVGRPQAIRAVASIVGKNPEPIKVPCHRVIRSNGEIGQYTWQSKRNTLKKLALLKTEGVFFLKKKTKTGYSYILLSASKGAIL